MQGVTHDGAIGLLAELHGRVLRHTSGKSGIDFQGLQQASSWLRKKGNTRAIRAAGDQQLRSTCKRMASLEISLKFAGHITGPRAANFFNEVEEAIRWVASFDEQDEIEKPDGQQAGKHMSEQRVENDPEQKTSKGQQGKL